MLAVEKQLHDLTTPGDRKRFWITGLPPFESRHLSRHSAVSELQAKLIRERSGWRPIHPEAKIRVAFFKRLETKRQRMLPHTQVDG